MPVATAIAERARLTLSVIWGHLPSTIEFSVNRLAYTLYHTVSRCTFQVGV